MSISGSIVEEGDSISDQVLDEKVLCLTRDMIKPHPPKKLSFDECMEVGRNLGSRYTHALSAKLADSIGTYLDEDTKAVDLASEMAILRTFVEDALVTFDKAKQLPAETQEEKNIRYAAVKLAQADLERAIGQVITGAKTYSDIMAKRHGKIDAYTANALAGTVAASIDSVIRSTSPQLEAAGIDPQQLADKLAESVITKASQDSGEAVTFSNKPSDVSSEDILRQMLETVPAAEAV